MDLQPLSQDKNSMSRYAQRAERYAADMDEEYRAFRSAFMRMLSYDKKINKMLVKMAVEEQEIDPELEQAILTQQQNTRFMAQRFLKQINRYTDKYWTEETTPTYE